jgi:Domain of unknown function (DUF4032)/Lipopolysaccharide kinase (Kdo/WaaP) family
MGDLSIRLRRSSPGLLSLPWLEPLERWPADAADFRELPVGPSRHVVRFVVADSVLYALKELPTRVARKEYQALRDLEARTLPAVTAVGLVEQPTGGNAILVTEFLDHSWQYRRLFQRLPRLAKHRERLLDAMAILLVDLHRAGVFWGDCSLANTLFKRDGQALQAFLVDAETSEVHPRLSGGQRNLDLGILVDNVTGDLLDLAVALGGSSDEIGEHIEAASSVATRYQQLWDELTHEEVFGVDERDRVASRVRRLNELGFAVDEVELEPAGGDSSRLRLEVFVANRRFHVEELRRRTGLEVGEGQAEVLLADLCAYQAKLEREEPGSAGDRVIGDRWLAEAFRPGLARAVEALGGDVDPIQAYCDLLEVRWLLSEREGHDVGDEVALKVLASRTAPDESAAQMAVVDAPTETFPPLPRGD